MYEYEYEHTGIDSKGTTRTFWSLAKNVAKNEHSSFADNRWLKECAPTGKSRKYQEPIKAFSSPNSYAFYH